MMKSMRVGATLLPMLSLLSFGAHAEDASATTLRSLDQMVILTGKLTAADAETYTIETVAGVYLIRRADVDCSGFCPAGDVKLDGVEKVAQSG